jgi:hypothetical protein
MHPSDARSGSGLNGRVAEYREFDDEPVLVLDHRSGRGHGACKGPTGHACSLCAWRRRARPAP